MVRGRTMLLSLLVLGVTGCGGLGEPQPEFWDDFLDDDEDTLRRGWTTTLRASYNDEYFLAVGAENPPAGVTVTRETELPDTSVSLRVRVALDAPTGTTRIRFNAVFQDKRGSQWMVSDAYRLTVVE